jgi:hypothetical protein
MTTLEQTVRCDRESRITKSLLGYGVIAGPIYVVVSLAQALTRQGFDLTRHAWSLLSTGDLGWIQVTNFVLTGLMTVAAAVGLRRAAAGRWASALVAGYGLSLVAAGVFRADPAAGFPAGTAENGMSWHGTLHLLAGSAGVVCLIAACVLVGRSFARSGHRGWAAYSWIAGFALLAGFAGVASGSHGAATTLPFAGAVILVSSWLTALSVRLYRHA